MATLLLLWVTAISGLMAVRQPWYAEMKLPMTVFEVVAQVWQELSGRLQDENLIFQPDHAGNRVVLTDHQPDLAVGHVQKPAAIGGDRLVQQLGDAVAANGQGHEVLGAQIVEHQFGIAAVARQFEPDRFARRNGAEPGAGVIGPQLIEIQMLVQRLL